MKIRLSLRLTLRTTVVVIILAVLPGTIRRLIHTGNLYLFTEQFFSDMAARLSGPGRFRFIMQPTVAIFLGVRDGMKDGRARIPTFLWALVFHGQHRWELLRSAFASASDLISIAILLDLIAQFLIFREIHPGAALLLGPVLIAIPYAMARTFGNWISRSRAPS